MRHLAYCGSVGSDGLLRVAGLLDQMAGNDAVDDAEHAANQRRVGPEEKTHWERKAQHPLSNGSLGQHLVNQPGRAVSHTPRPTTGAEATALATEREQIFGVAGVASQPKKPVLQPAALQVGLKRLPHMAGQLFTGLGQALDKVRVMALDNLIQQRLHGPVALVAPVAPSEQVYRDYFWRSSRGHAQPFELYLYTS